MTGPDPLCGRIRSGCRGGWSPLAHSQECGSFPGIYCNLPLMRDIPGTPALLETGLRPYLDLLSGREMQTIPDMELNCDQLFLFLRNLPPIILFVVFSTFLIFCLKSVRVDHRGCRTAYYLSINLNLTCLADHSRSRAL